MLSDCLTNESPRRDEGFQLNTSYNGSDGGHSGIDGPMSRNCSALTLSLTMNDMLLEDSYPVPGKTIQHLMPLTPQKHQCLLLQYLLLALWHQYLVLILKHLHMDLKIMFLIQSMLPLGSLRRLRPRKHLHQCEDPHRHRRLLPRLHQLFPRQKVWLKFYFMASSTSRLISFRFNHLLRTAILAKRCGAFNPKQENDKLRSSESSCLSPVTFSS